MPLAIFAWTCPHPNLFIIHYKSIKKHRFKTTKVLGDRVDLGPICAHKLNGSSLFLL
jgi:hypothetical protein